MPYSHVKYTGATPGTDSNTYTLFTTLGKGGNYFGNNDIHKVVIDLKSDQIGSFKAYKSQNGDAASPSWNQIYDESVAAPVSTSSTLREFVVDPYADWKLEWVNGGTAQGTWLVDIGLITDRADAGYSTLSEDAVNGVQAVAIRPTAVAAYAWSELHTTALAAKLIIKATAGVIRSISGRLDTSAGTAAYYLQLWNLADVPADATAVTTTNSLMAPYKIAHTNGTDNWWSLDFTQNGVYGGTGIVMGLSTTEFTKTASTALLTLSALYK